MMSAEGSGNRDTWKPVAEQEGDALYHSLVDNLPVGVALISREMEVLVENATMHRWFCKRTSEEKPLCYRAFNGEPRAEPCPQCPVIAAFRDGRRHQAERTAETSQGTSVLWITAIPTIGPDGEVTSVQEMVDDVTAQKEREGRLALQSTALENTADGVVITDREGVILWANPAFSTVTGYTHEEAAGKTPRILKSGRHDPRVYREMWRTILEGEVWRGELINRRRDGSLYVAENSITPVRAGGREITHFVAVQRDITERKEAEEELHKKSEAMEASREGIAILDAEERYTYLNTAHARLYGYESPAELLGKNWRFLYRQEEVERFEREVFPLLQREGSWNGEARGLKKNGGIFPVQVSLTVLGDGGLICVVQDISDRKQAEQDRVARRTAEEANRAKSVFVSNMSHEIRTPLNAILGFAQILERDAGLTPEQAEQMATIVRSGRHLLGLINDILDMSKIEAGRLELKMSDFSFHDMLDDLEQMFRSRASGKGLQLLVERREDVPQYITADEAKLRQILVNLMANAVKFTESGGVAVRVRADRGSGDSEGAVALVVEVEDTGPGIPEEDRERVFDSFQQANATREAGGTGLGLAITKRLVEMMGGGITLESAVGRGTTFRFSLPVRSADSAEEERRGAGPRVVGLRSGAGAVRILVVDDQEDNRTLLSSLLEPMGIAVREAENGRQGLEIFEEWSPHAVLMDLRMPVMDGYEATRRIKATAAGRATPVIAVTASAFEEDEKDVLAAGVDGYVRKPFRPEELYEELRRELELSFIYDREMEASREGSASSPLTAEALSRLPAELIAAMAEAVEEGNTALLEEQIGRVEELAPETARGVQSLAARYDYETLLDLFYGEGGQPHA